MYIYYLPKHYFYYSHNTCVREVFFADWLTYLIQIAFKYFNSNIVEPSDTTNHYYYYYYHFSH